MFAHIKHIDDVIPHITGRKDFVHKVKDGYQVIDYVFEMDDSFDNEYRLECRGIKFHLDGTIMSRPFHKFFNVNQRADNQAHIIDLNRPHILMEKMDGSMVHSAVIDAKVVLMTRMGRTDVAKKAEELLNYDICAMCRFLDETYGSTPIFEYTAPDNRIVIQYSQPELTLLAIRHKVTGIYLSEDVVEKYGRRMGVKPLKVYSTSEYTNMVELVATKREIIGSEGYVIRFTDNDEMLKIKGDDYVSKHRAKDGIHQEKNALLTVLNGTMDDVLPLLDSRDETMLRTYSVEVLIGMMNSCNLVHDVTKDGKHLDQKDFAMLLQEHVPSIYHKLCYMTRKGANTWDELVKHLIKSCSTNQNVEQQRTLFNAKWKL